MLDKHFAILSVLIVAIGSLNYLIKTIKGKVKPNRVSYFLWSLAPFTVFVAQIQKDVGIQSLLAFSVAFFPLTILVASFFNKHAEWKLRRFDLLCGGLSLIGLMLWLITREGNVAITFGILADGLAALPTITKSYHYPKTESGWSYLASAIGAAITLLTITEWRFASAGFSVYILIICFITFALVHFNIGYRVNILITRICKSSYNGSNL